MNINKIVFTFLFCVAYVRCEPLLLVVLMVKNEALVIQQTLQPLVDGGIKDFVIFDTGSTDGTQEIVKEFFRKHNLINTHVLEEPFIDFGTSRSHALDAAQHLFPEATFMLMLDAEWYMHNAEDLLTFCAAHKDDGHDSYFLSIRSDRLAFYVTRLIRCQRGIRFVGAVHEALNRLTAAMVPDTIYFEWRPSRKGNEKSAQRWQRDRDLLLKSYAENPFDARTLFYLGQTYECLGDWENAYTFYTKRAEINGWDQENFMTRMRLGDVAQHRALQDEVGMCPLVIRHYLEAFSLRPHRAEPLIKIAHYYVQRNEMQLAFLCAVRAVQIPYPANDVLFVEKYLYDFVRYDILGRCAWYVGEYELGEWAVRKALAVHPEAAYLQRNLTFYIDRKNSNHE